MICHVASYGHPNLSECSALLFQLLADGVIPNEYGINPTHKLKIGSKVNFLLQHPNFVCNSYDARNEYCLFTCSLATNRSCRRNIFLYVILYTVYL